MNRILTLSFTLSALLGGFLNTATAGDQNVILITWDGVRPEDLTDSNHILGGDYIPNLRRWASAEGYFFGSQTAEDVMWVGNPYGISRPGYRALFTGHFEEECKGNYADCSPLRQKTFVDAVIDHGISPQKIGLFASWKYLDTEMEFDRRAVRSVFPYGVRGLQPGTVGTLEKFAVIQKKSLHDLPALWENARFDKYTWQMGMEFLKSRPRLLYISLLDSDEWAHKYHIEAYSNVIKTYDQWIQELRKQLAGMKGYGENTTVIITTDHGRGHWDYGSHGPDVDGSEEAWAYVIPSQTLRAKYAISKRSMSGANEGRPSREGPGYSQLDIRPTVQAILGVPRSSLRKPLLEFRKK